MKKYNQNQETNSSINIISGSIKNSELKKEKSVNKNVKKKIFSLLVLVMVLLSVIGFFAYYIYSNDKKAKREEESRVLVDIISITDINQKEQAITNSNINELDKKLLLAGVKMKQQDYQGAISILKGLENSYSGDINLYGSLAYSYESIGQRDAALTYYKKQLESIKNLKDDYPLKGSDILSVEDKIKELGG